MYCLYCGDCCRRMSPISNPDPCPFIIEDGTFTFCSVYESRPKRCADYEYPNFRFCPIGMDVLNLSYPEDLERIRMRIDDGYEKIKEILRCTPKE